MDDPYEVLGVPEDASDEQVEAAYRQLARRWHPDRFVGAAAADRAEAEARFASISGAYRLLKDPAALARWRGVRRRNAGGEAKTSASPRTETSPPQPPSEPEPSPTREEPTAPFDYRAAAGAEFFQRPPDAPRTPRYGYTARAEPTPPASRPAPARSRRGRRILGSLALVLVVVPLLTIGLIRLATTDGPPTGARASAPHGLDGGLAVPTSALAVGECFDMALDETATDGIVRAVRPRGCSLPHHLEVVGTLALGDALGSVYPGGDAIVGEAGRFCGATYEQVVGVPVGPAMPLSLEYVFPSPASWAEGDRLVICAVGSHDGAPLVGRAVEVVGAGR